MPKNRVNSAHLNKVANMIEGFTTLIEKGAIKVDSPLEGGAGTAGGITMHLFPEIWQSNPKAFIANAYRFFRLKKKVKEGTPIYFKDIETGTLIGTFQKGQSRLL